MKYEIIKVEHDVRQSMLCQRMDEPFKATNASKNKACNVKKWLKHWKQCMLLKTNVNPIKAKYDIKIW